MKRGHYHVGEGITGHVAETGRPHVIEDISQGFQVPEPYSHAPKAVKK